MVVTSKPITKYCCSDTTQTEARVIAYFSILTTIFCLLVLFITYSQVQSEFFYPTLTRAEILKNRTKANETIENDSKNSSDCVEVSGRLDLSDFDLNRTEGAQDERNQNQTQSQTSINSTRIDLENKTFQAPGPENQNISQDGAGIPTRAPLETEQYHLRLAKERLEQNSTIDGADADNWDRTLEKEIGFKNVTLFEELEENQVVICGDSGSKTENGKAKEKVKGKEVKKKRHERGHLDLMAEFLCWDADTQLEWILPPFLWNVLDLIRGLLLLLALRKRNAALARCWWHLTALQCFLGILLFVPIVISLANGEFVTIFILMFLLVLAYNFYGMWIVNTLVSDITSVATEREYYNKAFEMDKVTQVEVIPVMDRFRVSFQPGT